MIVYGSNGIKNHHESLGKHFENNNTINIKNITESNPFTNVSELVKYIEDLNNREKDGIPK